jgi:hypothetical protein
MRLRSILCCAALAAAVLPAAAQDHDALLAQHEAKKAQLAQSAFGRPLLLEANALAEAPRGHVYAVVEHPFASVAGALKNAAAWCDVLMLQSNIKRCLPAGNERQPVLQVAIGRKSEQTAEDAFQVEFRYALRAAREDYLAVQLSADEGPVGTSDYRLGFEAVPLGPQKTFVRMSYSYATGAAARMATELYLSTSGRNKVGFSITGRNSAGKPVYVKGVQGVAERNTMRYFLAIEALLDSLSAPPAQQAEKRLRDWFAATERYPQQLHELDEAEYMAMKRRELQVAAARRKGGAS